MGQGRTLQDYNIGDEAVIHVIFRLIGGGGLKPTKLREKLGLVDIAQAVAIWEWDGIIPVRILSYLQYTNRTFIEHLE